MTELKEIILEENKKYKFKWMHEKYGWASFQICPVFKYGKLRAFHMYPRQQEADYYYKIAFKYPPRNGFIIMNAVGLGAVETREYGWCKEHKCTSFRVNVPRQSEYFIINDISTFYVIFCDNKGDRK
jgi:hypothetical protein